MWLLTLLNIVLTGFFIQEPGILININVSSNCEPRPLATLTYRSTVPHPHQLHSARPPGLVWVNVVVKVVPWSRLFVPLVLSAEIRFVRFSSTLSVCHVFDLTGVADRQWVAFQLQSPYSTHSATLCPSVTLAYYSSVVAPQLE